MNLAELDDGVRKRVLGGSRIVTLARNDAVYRPGDAADRVFFLETGRVKIVRTHVSGAETIVGIRAPGDIFGELGVLEPDRLRSTSAVAVESSSVRAVPAAAFARIFETDAGFARAFTGGVTRRLTVAERELTELAGKSVPGRLVDALGRLAAMYGEDGGEGTVRIGINLTHNDLADLIGTSRETLTKELSVLADVGLVRVAHKTVTLVQPSAFPFARRRE